MKNYYKVLGVLETAEIEVIKAAYRVLAQKYHPDRWKGDSEEAHDMMSAINEAYENLSDSRKRKKYDAELKEQREKGKASNEDNDSFGETNENAQAESGINEINKFDNSWKQALEYYPDTKQLLNKLKKYSKETAFTFQLSLIESGNFKEREKIFNLIQDNFLKKFFTKNKKIQEYAKKLIMEDKRDLALELNRAAKLFKSNIDDKVVIDKIKEKEIIRENSHSNKTKENNRKKEEVEEPPIQLSGFVICLAAGTLALFILGFILA